MTKLTTHCCGWCNKIYQGKQAVNPHKAFCSQSCIDAEKLFRQLCQLQHAVYINQRRPRIKL